MDIPEGQLPEALSLAASSDAIRLASAASWITWAGCKTTAAPRLWRLGDHAIAIDGQPYPDLTRHCEGTGPVELLARAIGCDDAVARLA